jgi:hypothetical protein
VLLPLLSWLLLHKRLHKKLLLQRQRLMVRLQQRLRLKKTELGATHRNTEKEKSGTQVSGFFV